MTDLCQGCKRPFLDACDPAKKNIYVHRVVIASGPALSVCGECFNRALAWAARQALTEQKLHAKLTSMHNDLDAIRDGLTANGASDV